MEQRIQYASLNPNAVKALATVTSFTTSISRELRALVELRVSQMNGCGYCLWLHSKEARETGESQHRLDCLAGWREAPYYSSAERLAFEWAESLTQISTSQAPDELFRRLQEHFKDDEIVDLTFIVAAINSWNRVAISMGHSAPVNAGNGLDN